MWCRTVRRNMCVWLLLRRWRSHKCWAQERELRLRQGSQKRQLACSKWEQKLRRKGRWRVWRALPQMLNLLEIKCVWFLKCHRLTLTIYTFLRVELWEPQAGWHNHRSQSGNVRQISAYHSVQLIYCTCIECSSPIYTHSYSGLSWQTLNQLTLMIDFSSFHWFRS